MIRPRLAPLDDALSEGGSGHRAGDSILSPGKLGNGGLQVPLTGNADAAGRVCEHPIGIAEE
jgi:hypothetical protein